MITKLVRDRIPALFDADGKEYTLFDMKDDPDLIISAYAAKIIEEALEVAEELLSVEWVDGCDTTRITEELADLLEIIQAIRDYFKIDGHLEYVQEKKWTEKGGFENKTVIIY